MTLGLRVILILLALSVLAGAVTGSLLYFRLSYLWGGVLLLSSDYLAPGAARGQRQTYGAFLTLTGWADIRRTL